MTQQIIVTGAAGRMGSTICNLVKQDPDLKLVAAIETPGSLNKIKGLDVLITDSLRQAISEYSGATIIDFTYPDVTIGNVDIATEKNNPMVIGTTGLSNEQMDHLKECAKNNPIFWAPNMSVGINVLLKLLPKFVDALGELYDVEISEIHHRFKKDAPSGTALKIAEVLAGSKKLGLDNIKYCRHGNIGERPRQEIGVQTLRGGDVVGDHTVYFFGPGERIEITHRAHSRETFAQGAIRAAKWICNKKPGKLYTMSDLLEDV